MEDKVTVFLDTIKRIGADPKLKEQTRQAVSCTRIYEENFRSLKSPCFSDSDIGVLESLTLIPAVKAARSGKKTAVLNFANPVEPGGGVLRGANAQEEYLCRASNLYRCLSSANARPYYDAHNFLFQENGSWNTCFLSSDRVIYSPNVTVIREDIGYKPGTQRPSEQAYTDNWTQLDVITCAAPYFRSAYDIPPREEWEALFTRRIVNILEVAIENGTEVLILGAFGCGAFHNPPQAVAEQFQKVFREERYQRAFEKVIFTVKRTGDTCQNTEAFRKAFPEVSSKSPSLWERFRRYRPHRR